MAEPESPETVIAKEVDLKLSVFMDKMNEFRHEMRWQLTSILDMLRSISIDWAKGSLSRLAIEAHENKGILSLLNGASAEGGRIGLGFPLYPVLLRKKQTKSNWSDPTGSDLAEPEQPSGASRMHWIAHNNELYPFCP